MTRRLFLCAIVALLCGISSSWAQSFSISTNIPSLLTGNINVEPSIGLGSRVSLQLSLQVKPFKFGIPLPTGLIHTAYHNAKLDSKDRFDWSTVEHTYMGLSPYISMDWISLIVTILRASSMEVDSLLDIRTNSPRTGTLRLS